MTLKTIDHDEDDEDGQYYEDNGIENDEMKKDEVIW